MTQIQRVIDQRKRIDVARAELSRTMTEDQGASPEVLKETISKYTKDGTLSNDDAVVVAAQARLKTIQTRDAIVKVRSVHLKIVASHAKITAGNPSFLFHPCGGVVLWLVSISPSRFLGRSVVDRRLKQPLLRLTMAPSLQTKRSWRKKRRS